MNTPWARARRAQTETEVARLGLEHTLSMRPRVEAIANDLRHHKVLNGWTNTIATIFGGQ